MNELTICKSFANTIFMNNPLAYARIKGNADNPNLWGIVTFYSTCYAGILVNIQIYNLPFNDTGFYGLHIHEFGNCALPFDKTGNHYNPTNTTHPHHIGDMPPLLGNNGYAWMAFYDTRLTVQDIIGKSIVIHNMRDDFTSQPSGDSGNKIGCGIIKAMEH